MTQRAAFAPGEAKDDWAIIRALSARLGAVLPFDTLPALRSAMYKTAPQLARIDHVDISDPHPTASLAEANWTVSDLPFTPAITDFYMTNPIARASAVMAELSAFKAGQARAQAAE
jgi:NADH-quinone oxidoreductase subunit G